MFAYAESGRSMKEMRKLMVTFHTKAYADITMFGDVAVRLLELMGHSGTVPSAILPEDIPEALKRLRAGVEGEENGEADEAPSKGKDSTDEPVVSLKTRAFPLIELLEAAVLEDEPVSWE